MIPLRLIDARTLGMLSRLLVALAVIVATIVVLCFGRTYLSLQSISVSDQQISQSKANLEMMNEEIRKARAIKSPPATESRQAVFAFQSAVEAAAQANGAIVEEYASSPEKTPYLSKYHNDSPPEGWQQVAARVHLSGRMPEIYETMRALQAIDIPHEIDMIDLNRTQAAAGESRVAAVISLRVLVRS
jgi:hypothetical protein